MTLKQSLDLPARRPGHALRVELLTQRRQFLADHGVQAAAHTFFGKDVSELAPAEATQMVMVAVVVGLAGGYGAILFRHLVDFFQGFAVFDTQLDASGFRDFHDASQQVVGEPSCAGWGLIGTGDGALDVLDGEDSLEVVPTPADFESVKRALQAASFDQPTAGGAAAFQMEKPTLPESAATTFIPSGAAKSMPL